MGKIIDFQHVTTTMRDQKEALWFYRDLLGFDLSGRLSYRDDRNFIIDFMEIGENYLLELFYFNKELYKPTERIDDDKQEGMRQIGFRTNDLDGLVKRLTRDGVEIISEPQKALGNVRIAIARDPSGTVIKFVEGQYQYDVLGDVPGFISTPNGDGLVFDQLTVTVADFEESYDFYHNIFKFPYLGRIKVEDASGMTIDHFQMGKVIVELLSFNVPTFSYQRNNDNTHLGLRHFGLLVDEVDPVMAQLQSAGAPILYPPVDAVGGVRTCFFSDPNTVAIELINGTCTYDE